ncbi:hypothetical protein KY289_001534 [Solanum tuberosum]|nr:hypothetical protein KY289_001534 [Solanum tuberosum]
MSIMMERKKCGVCGNIYNIKVVGAIFSTTSVVICCDPLLQQGVVALIISSLSLISCQDCWIVIPFEILSNFKNLNLYKYMGSCQKKIVLTKETADTKIQIQKRPRTRTCRKNNENSTTTLLEELVSEAISSSQVEAEFSQKEYEERQKEKNEVDDDGERAEEVEEEEGNKKEVEEEEGTKKEVEEDKGKQKEVEEEEGKNKEVVKEEEEQINEVDEDKRKQKEVEEEEQEKNEVEDDGIKTINAHSFPMHLQPNATGDSIMRSAMGKSFDTFRITLKQNGLENPEKNDEILINYCGMPLFFSRREFAIVSGLNAILLLSQSLNS